MHPNELSIDQAFLQKLKETVLENLENEQFGVEDLSKKVGISRSQLHRKLKKLKSKSVSEFIREVRLQEAMNLLQQNVATASEIAYRVGFSSPSYFFKCFQKYYGFPPGEVQKSNAEDPGSKEANQKGSESDFPKPTGKRYKSIIRLLIIFLFVISTTFFGFHYFQDLTRQKLEKSIAVLPFKSLSTDKDNQHFTDGLVDDLLSRLALISELEVTSRTSSETFRDQDDMKIQRIAAELGVSYIVEGSVQKYDDKVRIIIQLIDAVNDDHIWVKTFDRDLTDVYEVQREVTMQVASGLSMVLTEQQTKAIQKNQTENVKAMELYQLGRFHWGKRTPEGLEAAIDYYQQAIDEDPKYALAYAGIADTYFLKNWLFIDLELRMECRNKSEEYALKALRINPNLTEAHTVLATLNFFIDWDWAAAEEKFQHAFRLNSNYSTLHFRYAEFLAYTGRISEARYHMNKAIELDPFSYVIRRNSADLYLTQRQFQKALNEAKFSENLNKEIQTPHYYQFMAHCLLGNELEALKSIKKAKSFSKTLRPDSFYDSIFEKSGVEGLLRWLAEVNNNPLNKAGWYNLLGENENTLHYLELSYTENRLLTNVMCWYSPNNLQSEPRFKALMEKMGLPWNPEGTE